MTDEEYKKLLIDTLDTGWSLDYQEAVGILGKNYDKSYDRWNNDFAKLVKEYRPSVSPSLVYDEIHSEEDPYHYTNPRSYELMGELILLENQNNGK